MMDSRDIENRFTFHPANEERKTAHEQIREKCGVVAHWINGEMPDCREKSLAITALEEAMFWANAGIAREPE